MILTKIKDTAVRAALGGVSISLFAGMSVLVHDAYVGPFVFMTGIILIIVYQLSLVTRDCPLGCPAASVAVTLTVNVLTAFCMGLLFRGHLPYEVTMKADLFQSVLAGVIIGMVSLVNRDRTIYTIPLTVLLMYAFVWCRLPHCVVYGFYMPICGGSWVSLAYAIAGNLIGGWMVHKFDEYNRRR